MAASRKNVLVALVASAVALLGACACCGFAGVYLLWGPADATGLAAKYAADPDTFHARYGGARMTVKGRVVGSVVSMGETAVELGGSDGVEIVVRFASPADAATAAGSRGVVVTGVMSGSGPVLNKADLLWSY